MVYVALGLGKDANEPAIAFILSRNYLKARCNDDGVAHELDFQLRPSSDQLSVFAAGSS